MSTVSKKKDLTIWITLGYFVLAFYTYGATVVEVFVYYPSWIHIHDDWVSFKQGVDIRLISLYVVPTFLLYIPLIAMFWHRLAEIPKWAVWLAFVLFSIPAISTFLLQLPIQLQLAKGWDESLYNTLMTARWPTRQIWALLSFLFNGYLLFRIIKGKVYAQP